MSFPKTAPSSQQNPPAPSSNPMSSFVGELASGPSATQLSVFKANDQKHKVPAVVFLSGDKYIITCSRDDCLQVIEAKTGKPVGDPWKDGEGSRIYAIAVSPNGRFIATGSKDGKIRLWTWNGDTAKIIAKSDGYTAAANCVRWSPHDGGAHIASGFDDGRVAVWSRPSKEWEFKNPASTHDTGLRNIYVIDYSHDGRQLIVSGYGSNVSVLGVKKREFVVDRVIKICSDPDQVSCATWVRTADGHVIVTGSTDGKIKMHTSEPSGSLLHEWGDFQGHSIRAIVQSPDKRILLASVLYDHTVRLLDLKSKRLIGQPLQHSAEVSCAAFTAGGTLLATGTRDGEIYVWEILDLLSEATENVTDVHHTDVNVRLLLDTGLTFPRPTPSGGEPTSPSSSRTFWTSSEGTLPVDNNVPTNTPKGGTSGARRWTIPQYVSAQVVAAARTLQSLGQMVTRTRMSEMVDAPRNEGIGIGRQTFGMQQQQTTPLHPAVDQQLPAAGSIAEDPRFNAASSIRVPRTRWVKMWMYICCIPEKVA